jgi:hypothetical protein
MFFSVISRTGRTVDSGVIHRGAADEKRFEHEDARREDVRDLSTTRARGPSHGR